MSAELHKPSPNYLLPNYICLIAQMPLPSPNYLPRHRGEFRIHDNAELFPEDSGKCRTIYADTELFAAELYMLNPNYLYIEEAELCGG